MKKKVSKKKVHKKGEKKFNFKEFFTSEKTLLVIFCLLIVVILVLGVMIFKKEKEKEKEKYSNIVVPIIDIGAKVGFKIDAEDLKNAKEYIIKIPNYRKDKINSKVSQFHMIISNDSNAEIEVSRDKDSSVTKFSDSSYDLEEKIKTKDKEDLYYRIRITKKDVNLEGKSIGVNIES